MKKSYIFILVLLATLLAVFLSVRYVNQQNNEQLTRSLASSCTRTTGKIDTNVLGVGTPGTGLTIGDFNAIQDLGVKWLRNGVRWTYLEPTEGAYAWQEQDGVVGWVNKNNVNLLLGTVDVPGWVWEKDKQGRIDATYRLYKNLATRYKGKVRYYEFGGEPNLAAPGGGFFRPTGDKVNPATYLDFLAAENKAIHEVDPTAVVVLGGLSPDGMKPGVFMQKLYELGGKDCFDIFAYHPYGSGGDLKGITDKIRAGMSQYGYSTKPIWFTEFGDNSGDSAQVTAMNQMKDEISAVPAWFWFDLRDFDTADDNKYGLLTTDYQKRPSYDLFKQIIKSRQ